MRYYLSHEELWDLVSTRPDCAANRKRDTRALGKIGLLVQPQCLVHLEACFRKQQRRVEQGTREFRANKAHALESGLSVVTCIHRSSFQVSEL
jgi:hypothetical protein